MDCQTGLWMLVTEELCRTEAQVERIKRVERSAAWRRWMSAAKRRLAKRPAAARLVTGAKQVEG